jgi:hypothetical protein
MVRVNITVALPTGRIWNQILDLVIHGRSLNVYPGKHTNLPRAHGLVEITKPNSIPQPSGYSLAGLGVTSGSLALLAVSWDSVENAPQS